MEASRLADRVVRVRHSLKPGDPFPDDLRRAVVEWSHRQRSAGYTWREVCDRVGLSSTAIRNWTNDLAQPGGFHQLQVVDAAPEQQPRSELHLTTPNGYIVIGASVEQLAQLLTALG